ncbi:Type IX secretion system membrane protein, PorP/SprF family [Tenacibaculum sediminilitoris]|uniref:PorP/SprF family type IX secretion system membrane protein n=1 Tax=Tenacibaculum sediminilitoris TaxID=1820334 RepID=UPI0038932C23
MRIITYILVMMVFMVVNYQAIAQQDPQLTQYMYNTVSFNPAYAGSNNGLDINLLHRSQWVGLDGAPKTQAFSINTPIGGGNTALGLSAINDAIGPAEELYVTADFSHTLLLNNDVKLAFGLKGGIQSLRVDYTKLNTYDPTDVQLQQNVSQTAPQVGAGTFLYTDKWYLGASVPNLLKTDYYDEFTISTAAKRLHVFVIGGYVFQLNHNLKFKPATLIKVVSGAPIGFDVSANFLFNEKFTLGMSYRLDSSVSALAGFQISKSIMLGYTYDFDTTELARYNSGSHEFFMRFQILNNVVSGKVSPRFF